ncbi:hypothetical protein N4G40_03015 [Pantoea eucrina]|uniref:Phage protein n=1 Tax=Pantoea eucrina TaxID=472693 RepID=A0ABU5LBK5_9GAMM|nr:hypothetical protein [Pantoea eucrina]MDZ7277253.1 hypothetical protein [Pantoea eucrina]
MTKKYAVIKNGQFFVENTIVGPENFSVKDCYLIELTEDNSAQPGAYYNPDDGQFYGDAEYKQDFRQFYLQG